MQRRKSKQQANDQKQKIIVLGEQMKDHRGDSVLTFYCSHKMRKNKAEKQPSGTNTNDEEECKLNRTEKIKGINCQTHVLYIVQKTEQNELKRSQRKQKQKRILDSYYVHMCTTYYYYDLSIVGNGLEIAMVMSILLFRYICKFNKTYQSSIYECKLHHRFRILNTNIHQEFAIHVAIDYLIYIKKTRDLEFEIIKSENSSALFIYY